MHNILYNKEEVLNNVRSLLDYNIPLVSNLSNVSRLIFESIENVSWCGFYLSNDDYNILYLGPFQGPIACTTIPFGRGVCGTAAILMNSQLVENVHEYPGHIACSSLTNSELVVPIIKNGKCVGVLDLDSNEFSNFTLNDQLLLEEVCKLLSTLF